jgi:hypothetical protein
MAVFFMAGEIEKIVIPFLRRISRNCFPPQKKYIELFQDIYRKKCEVL